MAPLFSALLTRAAAVELNRADLTVSSWTPEVSLLTIMAARLGATPAALKLWKERLPLLTESVWQLRQYFYISAFCCAAGIGPAANAAELNTVTASQPAKVNSFAGARFLLPACAMNFPSISSEP